MPAGFEAPNQIQLGEYSMSSGMDGFRYENPRGERQLERWQWRPEREGELGHEPEQVE